VETHASSEKAMALLGLGRRQFRRIAVRDDFTIDVDALARRVAADREQGCRPICVIGNAGTTNTGAVDPLDALATFCESERLWFHVDVRMAALQPERRRRSICFGGCIEPTPSL